MATTIQLASKSTLEFHVRNFLRVCLNRKFTQNINIKKILGILNKSVIVYYLREQFKT